jgi:hypothetical protein
MIDEDDDEDDYDYFDDMDSCHLYYSHDLKAMAIAKKNMDYRRYFDEWRKTVDKTVSDKTGKTDNFNAMNNDVILEIFKYVCLDLQSFDALSMVCKKWWYLVFKNFKSKIYIPLVINFRSNNFINPLTYKSRDFVAYTKPKLHELFNKDKVQPTKFQCNMRPDGIVNGLCFFKFDFQGKELTGCVTLKTGDIVKVSYPKEYSDQMEGFTVVSYKKTSKYK